MSLEAHGTVTDGLDWVLRGGRIVDGTGRPAFRADVGLRGDRVAAVARPGEGSLGGTRDVDVTGLVVAPGFIDIHSHHDLYFVDQDPERRFGPYLRQGVTTCVVGNCGWSLAPCAPHSRPLFRELIRSMSVPLEDFYWEGMPEYLAFLDGQPLPCNFVQLVGHGALRVAVMGEASRFATPAEVQRMAAQLRESLDAGCAGLSSGLMYFPGMYAHTDELVALARVAAEYDRPYVSHIRGYCATLPRAVQEAVEIADRAAVQVQVSHLHAVPFFGRAAKAATVALRAAERINAVVPLPGLPDPTLRQALQTLERGLDRGLALGMDAVPYTLGNTTVTALFPPWANRGGRAHLLQRLADSGERARIRRHLRTVVPKWPHWDEDGWSDPYLRALGWEPVRVLSVGSEANRWVEGKTFPEIGRVWGTDAFDALCRLTLEEQAEVAFTFGYTGRPWIEKMLAPVLQHPLTSIGADTVLPLEGTPPPSAYGCFPRVLGHYARDLGFLSLEEAVYRMTGLPAATYGLEERGTLREHAFADVVVFDPRTVGESVDSAGQAGYARGIAYVFVNGVPVVTEGALCGGAWAGRLLRKR